MTNTFDFQPSSCRLEDSVSSLAAMMEEIGGGCGSITKHLSCLVFSLAKILSPLKTRTGTSLPLPRMPVSERTHPPSSLSVCLHNVYLPASNPSNALLLR